VNQSLRIGGFVSLSTVDYPGTLAAVVFCQGCSWRCRYCHNPELLPSVGVEEIAWSDVMNFLKRRQGLLDAVVFSGGEPILQSSLENAIEQVIELGYKVGLHTAGSVPERLNRILPVVNWIGLDIKGLEHVHYNTTGVSNSGSLAWESAKLIINSNVDYEIRITVHPSLITPLELKDVIIKLNVLGAKKIVVQKCRTKIMLDSTLQSTFLNFKIYQPVLDVFTGITVV